MKYLKLISPPLRKYIKYLSKKQPKKEATIISLQEELIKTIETLLQKGNNNQNSRDVASVIISINNNKYAVQIENSTYWIKNGVEITLHIGDPVWVHIPNGNMNEMFIMAKR